jgi:hypothetical protein
MRSGRMKSDYEVTKCADICPRWWFQVYKKRLQRTAASGGRVRVICDKGSPSQIAFAIPCSYLMNDVLPTACLERNGRYIFDVRKDTLEFVFRGGSRFDGKRFLVP